MNTSTAYLRAASSTRATDSAVSGVPRSAMARMGLGCMRQAVVTSIAIAVFAAYLATPWLV